MTTVTMDKIVSLAKRRGFVYPSSEIYGGINACWDYGPLGVRLKNNVKRAWWRAMTQMRDDVEGLDAAILMHPRVWEASGHVENFTDPLVDCKVCKGRFRADQLDMVPCPDKPSKHPGEHHCELTEPRQFNMMFKTFMGPVEESANVIYMRPETAQGIYVNFHNVMTSSRQKVPFGIAQIGKAFRNEITPGNFIFRTREFEQMEMQFFVHPDESEKWFEHWKEQRSAWYDTIGIRKEKLRFHQHAEGELAHYAKAAFDIEYEFPFGWQELEGIHNRGDFDLGRHQEYSKKKLEYFDEVTRERYIPYIIETSAGCDRTLLTALIDAYREDVQAGEERDYLAFHPSLAPIKAAIFPLVKKEGMPEIAQKLTAELRSRFEVFYDEKGSIGKRYRRMDEVGTPFCVTIDTETLSNDSVTVRVRDTLEQERVNLSELRGFLEARIG
ncbi:MAG: glycine--tRNA ligase [Candidatus Eisenbacteria bacterium]|uniref:Glycine--tRNA ligase n=1 Tax=Eiseniibacteriota bacterium TaxID=2212470 RepID=A0A956SBI7_UNCEI|nr:glycine--tRNA ligase [Candidatus Eisenbacteria bacterium]MCB9462211.1 glycine--tRNA ligase [Candidatus Eisenbacteria bacterium]